MKPKIIDAEFEVVSGPTKAPAQPQAPQRETTEWADWNVWGRITYVIVFVGLMAAVIIAARWAVYEWAPTVLPFLRQ